MGLKLLASFSQASLLENCLLPVSFVIPAEYDWPYENIIHLVANPNGDMGTSFTTQFTYVDIWNKKPNCHPNFLQVFTYPKFDEITKIPIDIIMIIMSAYWGIEITIIL